MYVVRYKGNVILGIIPWNAKYITNVMKTRYRIDVDIPAQEPSATEFPYEIIPDLVVYPAEEDGLVAINPMIEYYYGPVWEFIENKVIAHYEVHLLPLENAKNNFKEKATNLRYEKEVSGVKVEINNTEYNVETDRESRSKFVQKLISMQENQTVNWKFGTSWEVLTKQQVHNIVSAIDNHVQSAFDEEYQLNVLINEAQESSQLLLIEQLNNSSLSSETTEE